MSKKESKSLFSFSTNKSIENQGENANINDHSGNTNTINILSGNFVTVALVGIIALGGLAWGLGLRVGKDGITFNWNTRPKVIKDVPPSGVIEGKVGQYFQVKDVTVKFEECLKENTKAVNCRFSLNNRGGDANIEITTHGSKITQTDSSNLNIRSVQFSDNRPDYDSSLVLYNSHTTEAIFSFRGVAPEVKKISVFEAMFEVEGTRFKMQYRNFPLN